MNANKRDEKGNQVYSCIKCLKDDIRIRDKQPFLKRQEHKLCASCFDEMPNHLRCNGIFIIKKWNKNIDSNSLSSSLISDSVIEQTDVNSVS